MRIGYQAELALPPQVAFAVTWQNDQQVDQQAVDRYVDSLARPGWYRHDHARAQDTRLYMLEVRRPFNPVSINGRLTRTWTCECCGQTMLYEAVHLGHVRRWRDELKRAGVLSAAEARAAYNNLNNLRLECATCNQSHDWE